MTIVNRLLLALLLVVTLCPVARAGAWDTLFVHDEIRLMQHTSLITGSKRCWVRAVFRSKPVQFYMLAIGFQPDGRLTFYLSLIESGAWFDTTGHALQLADGRAFPLETIRLPNGEGLGVRQPALRDQVVRALIEKGGFELRYATLEGPHYSVASFPGLRAVVQQAMQRCEDARRLQLP